VTVSLIIPVYNRGNLLLELFDSLKKNNAAFHVIVVDDCSTDPRIEEIRSRTPSLFPDTFTVQWVRNDKNLGIARSTNRGIELVKTDYFALVDCDDYLIPNAVDILLEALASAGDVDFGFTDRTNYLESSRTCERMRFGNQRFLKTFPLKEALLFDMVASHLKFYKTELIRSMGGFDANVDTVIDYEMAMRLAWGNYKHLYIDSPLYVHRIHAGQTTESKWLLQTSQANIVRHRYLQKCITAPQHRTAYDDDGQFRECFAANQTEVSSIYFAIANGMLHKFSLFSALMDFSRSQKTLDAVLFVPNAHLPKDDLLWLYKKSEGNLSLGMRAEFNVHIGWFCFYLGFFRKIYVTSPIECFVFKSASYDATMVELVDKNA